MINALEGFRRIAGFIISDIQCVCVSSGRQKNCDPQRDRQAAPSQCQTRLYDHFCLKYSLYFGYRVCEGEPSTWENGHTEDEGGNIYLYQSFYGNVHFSVFTEILHLKNTLGLQFIYILKIKTICYLNNYSFLSHQCGNICFLINYKEFQAPQNCSSPQPTALFWGQNRFLCHLKYNNVFITINMM